MPLHVPVSSGAGWAVVGAAGGCEWRGRARPAQGAHVHVSLATQSARLLGGPG